MKRTALGGLLGIPLLLAGCAQAAPTRPASDFPPASDAAAGAAEVRTTRGGASGGATEAPAVRASQIQSAKTLAPDFSVETIDGQRFRLTDYQGEVVVVGFVANGCVSCQAHIQALARIDQQYRGQGVRVLILDVDPSNTPAALLAFKRIAKGGDHPWAIDKDGAVSAAYNVRVLETAVIIDREGHLVYNDVARTDDVLKKALETLL